MALVTLLLELRTPPSVVDEPIADLNQVGQYHDLTIRIVCRSYLSEVDAGHCCKMLLLLLGGIGIVHVLVEPMLHDIRGLLREVAALARFAVLVHVQ